jgi:hypothetical protein
MKAELFLACAALSACAPSVRFEDREILWRWHDDRPIAMPRKRALCLTWQATRDSLLQPMDRVLALDYLHEARNTNALDEVPDSSWFVDRRRLPGQARPRALTREEMTWGALDPDDAPVKPLTVIKGKELGSSPGFVVLDARHRQYMIKLDPLGYRGLTTSTELVVTRLAWAAGWQVPGIALVDAHSDEIRVASLARSKDRYGRPVPFTNEMLLKMLAQAPRAADGTVRLMASRWLPGVALGSFPYMGRVKDDPNDIIDHEDRRDLRGFGVFASWVNDIDVFENNTLDMYQGEPGKGHVVHYQQDVGGSFGNWAGQPAPYWTGTETILESHLVLRSLLTLGLWPRPFDDWRYRKWKEGLSESWPELGNFEAAKFDPRTWQPVLENPAFARQTARDRYWGAKRVVAIDQAELRAAIAAGLYRPAAADQLYSLLWMRRERIARAFFADVSPLDYFRVDGDRLCFDDLWVAAGLGATAIYRANAPVDGRCVVLAPSDGYRVIAVQALRPGERRFGRAVRVHLMIRGLKRRILGIER